jgi:hypothetical protein
MSLPMVWEGTIAEIWRAPLLFRTFALLTMPILIMIL